MNHPKIQPLTGEIAATLGLEERFVDFVFARERPVCFHYWCEPADKGWTCFVPDEFRVAHPLWSCNANQALLLVSEAGVSYSRGYHDARDMEFISRSSQGLLAYLLNCIYESEANEEEMAVAVAFTGFRYFAEFQKFRELIDGDKPRAPWEESWRRFIESIDAKG